MDKKNMCFLRNRKRSI